MDKKRRLAASGTFKCSDKNDTILNIVNIFEIMLQLLYISFIIL